MSFNADPGEILHSETTICEKYFKTMTPSPTMILLEELKLNLEGLVGIKLPYTA